jgi:hypothetical protein
MGKANQHPWKGGKNYENAFYKTIFWHCDKLEDMDAQREGDRKRATKVMGCNSGDG